MAVATMGRKDQAVASGRRAEPGKKKTAITAALTAGVLAAAGTVTPGDETSTTRTPESASLIGPSSAPILAAVATPNSLYAAGGAPQVSVLAQAGSGVPAGGTASGGMSPDGSFGYVVEADNGIRVRFEWIAF